MDVLLASVATVGVVGSFYLWANERNFARCALQSLSKASMDQSIYVDRDSTDTIRRRVVSFLGFSSISAAYLIHRNAALTHNHSVPATLPNAAAALLSSVLLFAGPLFETSIAERCSLLPSWLLRFRNLLLCPIGEELFFRGVLYDFLQMRSPFTQVIVSTLLFAMSHTHLVLGFACEEYQAVMETQNSSDTSDTVAEEPLLSRHCWQAAWRKMGILYFLTTLLGLVSGIYFTFACQRNLVAVSALHVLCNAVGPPKFTVLRSPHSSTANKLASAAIYTGGIAGWLYYLQRCHS